MSVIINLLKIDQMFKMSDGSNFRELCAYFVDLYFNLLKRYSQVFFIKCSSKPSEKSLESKFIYNTVFN